MLKGDIKQAKNVYTLLKNKTNSQGKDYKQVLEEDLNTFESKHIKQKEIQIIRQWLKETW